MPKKSISLKNKLKAKTSKPVKGPAKEKKPFMFEFDDFIIENTPEHIRMFAKPDANLEGAKQFQIKITRDAEGKAQFDIKFIKFPEEEMDYGQDLSFPSEKDIITSLLISPDDNKVDLIKASSSPLPVEHIQHRPSKSRSQILLENVIEKIRDTSVNSLQPQNQALDYKDIFGATVPNYNFNRYHNIRKQLLKEQTEIVRYKTKLDALNSNNVDEIPYVVNNSLHRTESSETLSPTKSWLRKDFQVSQLKRDSTHSSYMILDDEGRQYLVKPHTNNKDFGEPSSSKYVPNGESKKVQMKINQSMINKGKSSHLVDVRGESNATKNTSYGSEEKEQTNTLTTETGTGLDQSIKTVESKKIEKSLISNKSFSIFKNKIHPCIKNLENEIHCNIESFKTEIDPNIDGLKNEIHPSNKNLKDEMYPHIGILEHEIQSGIKSRKEENHPNIRSLGNEIYPTIKIGSLKNQSNACDKSPTPEQNNEMKEISPESNKFSESKFPSEVNFVIASACQNIPEPKQQQVKDIVAEILDYFEADFIRSLMVQKIDDEREFIIKFMNHKGKYGLRKIELINQILQDQTLSADKLIEEITAKMKNINESILSVLQHKVYTGNTHVTLIVEKQLEKSKALIIQETCDECLIAIKYYTLQSLQEQLRRENRLIRKEVELNLKKELETTLLKIKSYCSKYFASLFQIFISAVVNQSYVFTLH